MDTHSLPPWYLTGLLEGLASFGCAKNGRAMQPSLDLTLPAGEAELPERLRATLGGRLVRGGRTLRLTRTEDLLRIVEHLESFPLQGAARRRLGEAWSALVRERAQRSRRRPSGELDPLVQALRASRPGGPGRHARRAADRGAPGG